MMKSIVRLGLLLAGLVLGSTAQAGKVTYVYTDIQGTPVMESDAQGNITARFDYTPYGVPVQGLSGSPNGPGYTGHVNDPDTGFVYMQARYYDPAVGRFLSVNPRTEPTGSLFAVNKYSYVHDNPAINIDPTGMVCGGNGEVSGKVQAMRDTSDGCSGATDEHAESLDNDGALGQSRTAPGVAPAGTYTRSLPSSLQYVVNSAVVKAWVTVVRDSHDFNAPPGGYVERMEYGHTRVQMER